MQSIKQFSVFLPNKPGELARVMDAIAEAKINLVAITIVDTSEHGVVRIVGHDVLRIRKLLADLNVAATETDVLEVDLSNRSGALAKMVHLLAAEKINILYAYATSGAPGGRTTGILKVNNITKAIKVLDGVDKKKKNKKSKSAPRGRTSRG